MTKFVIFLRGINVGGVRIAMSELKSCLQEAELTNVKTYLQTGNVTCESDKSAETIKTFTEKALSAQFNYKAFVLVYTQPELEEIVKNYPWLESPPNTHRYAILWSDPKIQSELLKFAQTNIQPDEKVASGKNVIYWQVPRGITVTSSFGKFLGKPKFKSTTTNRNLNTLEKMI
ncbi:MAG: DUF1697 domain-containing protein [Fimbriimonadaceae bacterium]